MSSNLRSKVWLPETLKLSVHSGSDKFSIYPIIKNLIAKHDAGARKTAGTTWLEEVIGLAKAGGEALYAKEVYAGAYSRFEELTGPCGRDRYRQICPTDSRRSQGLGLRQIRQHSTPRPKPYGLQSELPPTYPCRLQSRRRND